MKLVINRSDLVKNYIFNTHRANGLTDLIVVGYELSDLAAIKLAQSHHLKYIAIVGSQSERRRNRVFEAIRYLMVTIFMKMTKFLC
jgi:hypothetical protein